MKSRKDFRTAGMSLPAASGISCRRTRARRGSSRRSSTPRDSRRCRNPASTFWSTRSVRRPGPIAWRRSHDRARAAGQGVRQAPRRACGARRDVRRAERRDHRSARSQRRRQDDAVANDRDARRPGRRPGAGRRPRRCRRPLRGARAHRCAVGCARPLLTPDRARERPLLRRAARPFRCAARRAHRRAVRDARPLSDRRSARRGVFARGADEGRDRARARPRPRHDPARRTDERPRHHERADAAHRVAGVARAGQVPALLVARDAGSGGAVRPHRHAVAGARRRGRHRVRADRPRRNERPRGCVRRAARVRRGPRGMTTSFGAALARTIAILRKELLDTLRDRRTGTVTLLSAILAGPIFLLLIFNLMAIQAEHAREMTLPVIGAEYAPAVVAFLQRQQVSVTKAPADYDTQIRRGDLDVVLVIDASFGKDVEQGKPGTVQLVFDRSRDRARPSIDQAESLLRGYNRLWGDQRLMLRGVTTSVANPLLIETADLATPQQSGALVLFLVAYYGLFASVMGGM